MRHLDKLNEHQRGRPHMNQRDMICYWGVNDVDFPVKTNGVNLRAYQVWRGMIFRCYDIPTQERTPRYIGCTVDERWRYFSVFLEWYNQNYQDGYDLDKDILIKGNRIYGPDTCCFVPHFINSIFTKSQSARGKYPIGVRELNGKFQARVTLYDKPTHLGTFATPEEAFYAYKTAKEAYIKDVATAYYYENKITKRVYDALMRYEVEITD